MSFTNASGNCLSKLPFVNGLSNSLFLPMHFRPNTYAGRKSSLLTYPTMQSSTSKCKLTAFNKYIPERSISCWAAALGASAVAKPALLATHQCWQLSSRWQPPELLCCCHLPSHWQSLIPLLPDLGIATQSAGSKSSAQKEKHLNSGAVDLCNKNCSATHWRSHESELQ